MKLTHLFIWPYLIAPKLNITILPSLTDVFALFNFGLKFKALILETNITRANHILGSQYSETKLCETQQYDTVV